MVTTKEWYTVEEAAEYLCISRRTVYKLTREGRLPAYRIGQERHRRFRKEDLDKVPRLDGETVKRGVPALTAKDDPILSELWNNDQDAVYDQI